MIGYTDDGTEFSYALSVDNIVVAEEIEAVGVVPTAVDMQVSFTLAEASASNMQTTHLCKATAALAQRWVKAITFRSRRFSCWSLIPLW